MDSVYIDNELIKVSLEESPHGLLFAHITVHLWNASVFKYIKEVWNQLQYEAWFDGHDHIACLSRNIKFVKMLDRDLTREGTANGIPFFAKDLKDYGN